VSVGTCNQDLQRETAPDVWPFERASRSVSLRTSSPELSSAAR